MLLMLIAIFPRIFHTIMEIEFNKGQTISSHSGGRGVGKMASCQ